ncbi:hypothetical protein O4J56_13990 [Nocardiopsis sp. RSe5-2]|uniref:Uncharacterized protein n=1 Tax=Nocardiopsis endophytica TaxID=3018445 RepID=A0ABT4U467_9ACTN|nr:hypothetical protein [Nocardiopsis endophytica]MDA2811748.1 hypothetical protein [Nocardiopsis endophytica]
MSEERADAAVVVRGIADEVRAQTAALDGCLMDVDGIAAAWRTVEEPLIVGEFCIPHLHRSVTEDVFPPDDDTLGGGDCEKLSDLYVIDSEPRFYDAGLHRLELLDLDYAEYVNTVLVTKGACGWQYLFADVAFDSTELRSTGADLQAMLDSFPAWFPRHDYAPLRARLEARR